MISIWTALVEIIPLFCLCTLVFLMLLALRDNKTSAEREVKLSFLLYLIAVSTGYLLLALYTYFPEVYIRISPLTLAVFMFTPVLFYRWVWTLTDTDRKRSFSYIGHFTLPALLVLILAIWSFFVPISVQTDMVMGREISPDYGAFLWLFKSRQVVGGAYLLCYILLSLLRAANYYRSMNCGVDSSKFTIRRMALVATPVLALPLVSGALLACFQIEWINSPLPIVLLLILFLVLYSIMGYQIICCRSALCSLSAEVLKPVKHNNKGENPPKMAKRVMRKIALRVVNTEGEITTVSLTRRRFEEYFREHKPHLNPELKITDLIEPLKANRTVISNFVNKTYGVNFNRYINRLRVKELERLRTHSLNKDREISKLLSKAGFSSMRNYTRALVAEQDNHFLKNR